MWETGSLVANPHSFATRGVSVALSLIRGVRFSENGLIDFVYEAK